MPNRLGDFGYVFVGALILLFGWFLFVKDKRYKRFGKKFGEESKASRKSRFVWCLLYVILSIASLFIFIAILDPASR
ncbi:MAG: hypothetical protein HKN25_02150 [Pyrinomonadaceae bacterium]|nr:hypothetical protein [Pyrinomonadaceae bacterium]